MLFHQLPFGTSETPLISDEVLYSALQAKLAAIEAILSSPEPDFVTAGLLVGDFEMEVMDACIPVPPTKPAPTGPGTGVANTDENPACCKLLVDAEYLNWDLGMAPP